MKIATLYINDRTYDVYRDGKRLDQGGDGVRWHCWLEERSKHLDYAELVPDMLQELFHGLLKSYEVRLTKAGERFFQYEERRVSDALYQTRTLVYVKPVRKRS